MAKIHAIPRDFHLKRVIAAVELDIDGIKAERVGDFGILHSRLDGARKVVDHVKSPPAGSAREQVHRIDAGSQADLGR